VSQQPTLQVPLLRLGAEGEKVKRVGILEHLLGQLGLRSGQRARKVADRPALPVVEATFHLRGQHVAAPAVLDGLVRVPRALGSVAGFVE
jgi:hypothetical protein